MQFFGWRPPTVKRSCALQANRRPWFIKYQGYNSPLVTSLIFELVATDHERTSNAEHQCYIPSYIRMYAIDQRRHVVYFCAYMITCRCEAAKIVHFKSEINLLRSYFRCRCITELYKKRRLNRKSTDVVMRAQGRSVSVASNVLWTLKTIRGRLITWM